MKKNSFLVMLLLLFSVSTYAQQLKFKTGPHFSNEDISDILLQRSKQQKQAAWMTLVAGPALMVAGGAIMVHQDYYHYNETAYRAGFLITTAGTTMAVSSVALFIAAATNKNNAKLLLKNEATSFRLTTKPASLPAVAIQWSL